MRSVPAHGGVVRLVSKDAGGAAAGNLPLAWPRHRARVGHGAQQEDLCVRHDPALTFFNLPVLLGMPIVARIVCEFPIILCCIKVPLLCSHRQQCAVHALTT